MAGAHPQEVDLAFAANNELRKRVHAAIDENPAQTSLFREISTYILNQTPLGAPEPATKKRKIDDSNGAPNGATGSGLGALSSAAVKAWKAYPATSFSIPQRKKLTLDLVAGKRDGGIRGIGAGGDVEFGISWNDIDQIFCLPVPEKAKRQHNFIAIPVHGDGVNPVPEHLKASPLEPIVWTFEEATGKNIIEGEDPGPQPMADAINQCLTQAGIKKSVIFPDAHEFESAIPQPHRKGEKAFHVKAHRGSKEGYLYFTAAGIVYGFKKPLAFFDFASINSVSYTNVLRNTFNLVIATPSQEVEFGMLDQADYEGINAYVQHHGLQDASLAAARRAKKLNTNPPAEKEGGDNGTAPGEDTETELEKAARLMQEQEEEEEEDEDFDPGSEGESEGSGTDSEDEEGNDYEPETGHAEDDGYEDEDEAMEA